MTLPLLLSMLMFGLLMAGITVFGYRRYARPGKIYERLGQPVGLVVPELVSAEKEGSQTTCQERAGYPQKNGAPKTAASCR